MSIVAMLTAACEGCAIPFEFTQVESLVLPLWVSNACDWGGSLPENGEPTADGELIRWREERDGNRCTVRAEWSGLLVEMESMRSAVDAQLLDAGLDPTRVGINITGLQPSIELVPVPSALAEPTSAAGALLDEAILEYAGVVAIDANAPFLSFAFVPPGDPLVPALDVVTPVAVVDGVNAAWRTLAPLRGHVSGHVVLALDRIQNVPEVPMVELRVHVTVTGDVFSRER